MSLRDSTIASYHKLSDEVTVQRTPRLGILCKDRSSNPKFSHPWYQGTYTVTFPDVCCRIVDNVTVFNEYMALHKAGAIIDHLTTFRGWADGTFHLEEATAALIKQHLNEFQSRRDEPEVIEELTLIVHNEGGETWGHWLVQNLPKVLVFKHLHPHGKIALPLAYAETGNNFGLSLRFYDIEPESIVALDKHKSYLFRNAAFVDHVSHAGAAHPLVFYLLQSVADKGQVDLISPRLFIERATRRPSREIENISEIAQCAIEKGFVRGPLGTAPFDGQVAIWQSATHFLSVLGSDFTGIVFGKTGQEILSVTPDFHGDLFFFDLAAAKGMVWHEMLCGQLAKERTPRQDSSFSIDRNTFSSFLTSVLG
ncbi:glycosyltransferase family 61 protein [Microvirga sp. BT689]|uniref:glycosyltransferase family 61 protein n=1 Tax=Microvirga arvi TaxID=2778731 RepID=UPI00194EB343|nr:glycosyltransferase family 61 protein [Microvirga arvi]MBM6583359.1 glycosyltransferase family 61 protein [Microvirga arvi]